VRSGAVNSFNNTADSFPYASMLLASVLSDCDGGDDNAQSILEEHVSRVWESSNGPTPGGSQSPGLRTPNQHRQSGRAGVAVPGITSVKGQICAVSKSASHRTRDDAVQLSTWHEDRMAHAGAVQRHGHRHQVPSKDANVHDTHRHQAPGKDATVHDSRQTRLHGSSSARTAGGGVSLVAAIIEHDPTRPVTRRSVESAGHSDAVVQNVSRTDQQTSHLPEVSTERYITHTYVGLFYSHFLG
jgi:hypothetical protein